MSTRKLIYILSFSLFTVALKAQGITYYSQANGSPNLLSNWNTLPAGGGTSPTDFNSGDKFIIQSAHSMATTATWAITNLNNSTSTITLQIDGTLIANNIVNLVDISGTYNTVVTISSTGIYTDNTGNKNNLKNLLVIPGTINNNGTLNINAALTGTNAINYAINNIFNLNINATVTTTGVGNSIYVGNNLVINSSTTLTLSDGLTVIGGMILNPSATVTAGGHVSVNNSLTLNSGSILDMTSSYLSVPNTLVLSGSGKLKTACTTFNPPISSGMSWPFPVEYYATGAQTIPAGTYTQLINSGSGTASLSGNISITNLLKVSAGTLSLNGNNITLKSTSISNTAQVDNVSGSINQSSGSFTVERYIPMGNRSYRDLGTVVYNNGGTLFSTWQESGVNAAGLGIQITGKSGATAGVDATTGFDITQTGNPSMYSYVDGFWTNGLTPTKSLTVDPYVGHRVLVRGDRTNNLFVQSTVMNAATTLRTSGKIITGSVTYTSLGVTNAVANSSYHLHANNILGYSMVANPYPAIVDWNAITKNGLVNRYYWYYDPTIGTSGSFVTYDASTGSTSPTSNATNFIQPGQAFFVQGDGVTPVSSQSLVFTEGAKSVSQSKTAVFGYDPTVSINKIAVSLYKTISGKQILVDGITALFSNYYSNALNPNEDAFKLYNSSDNIAINRNNNYISIEARKPVTENDSLPIKLWSLTNNATYVIKIDGKKFNFPHTLKPYILDKYSNTKTELVLGDTTVITFTPTSDYKTYLDRFVIVFSKSVTRPLAIKLTASESNYRISVDWTTVNENSLSYYHLQRSTDGVSFTTISNFIPNNSGSNSAVYNYVDEDAPKTTNYYRVEAGNIFGQVVYSSLAFVDLTVGAAKVNVYPNPITSNNFNVELDFVPAGNYTLSIYSLSGNIVYNEIINHAGGRFITRPITLNQQLPPELYVMKIVYNRNSVLYNQKIFIGRK